MAKQPQKPSAKKTAAKKSAAGAPKPVSKKPAAKKTAKTAAKKTAAKKTVGGKSTAKKMVTKNLAAAKKPAATKTAAKKSTAKKAAKKKPAVLTFPVAALLPDGPGGGAGTEGDGGAANAAPQITSPAPGGVPANADLNVTITTNRTDLPYTVTVTNGSGTVVHTVVIPVNGPYQVTIPGAALPAGGTYKIKVKVSPGAGATPPHGTDEVTVTTP